MRKRFTLSSVLKSLVNFKRKADDRHKVLPLVEYTCKPLLVYALGIKTNHMEYVLELDVELDLPNGHKVKPCLLQYDVECPYRICDAAFMTHIILGLWNYWTLNLHVHLPILIQVRTT